MAGKITPAVRIARLAAYADQTRALPANLAAHLQNVSRKRLASTAVAYSPMNLGIANVLLRHGFINSMTRGPPLKSSLDAPNPKAFDHSNPNFQALHLTLKYRSSFPVLSRARLLSTPKLHLYASHAELHLLLHGKRLQGQRGLGAGEVCVVRTPEGRYLEGWEAVAEGSGGEVLAAFG